MKKDIIYKMPWKRTSIPMWWQATSWHPKDKIQKWEIIQVTLEVRTNPIWFYHMWWVWVRAWRTYPINIGYRCTTKEAIQSKACWWPLKIKVRSQWKVASSTDSNAKGWTVMMNIWGSHQDFLVRGLGNIKRPPPQCMTTITSQVMIPLFQISALWGEMTKMSPEP